MTRHILKIDERWFARLADGSKTSEIRKHDRDFQIGDAIAFVEDWWPGCPGPTRRAIEATITHVLPASVFPEGLQVGYSVLSLGAMSAVYEIQEGQEP